jgi:adenylylsulfate kinase-like enzyme
MIIVFFGQPHSGKTTLATELQRQLFILERASYPVVDGDEIRLIFKNKDYSREGRIKNLNRISDISTFLAHQYRVVMVSAVYPIKKAREYFESIHEEVIWVYLTYNETRGREGFHVEDFNEPEELKNLIKINTTENGIQECIEKILPVYWAVSGSPRGSQVPVQEQN